jgi:hypothetical protein
MKDDDKREMVLALLRWLRLPGMSRALDDLLSRAANKNMTPLDLVAALADAEKTSRIESAVARRVRGARFAEIQTLDDFDFAFDPVRRKAKARYLALADLAFLDRGVCPIFVGPPGTGKTYLALVAGKWPARSKVLDKSLRKYLLPDGERRVQVVPREHPDAMPSLTLVRVARQNAAYSLLEVTIRTGRTHQIRVHLASEGLPIIGDEKYGDFELNKSLQRASNPIPLRRMFLHAWRLQFTHPHSGERIALTAELPSDLTLFLDHVQLASD